MPDLTGTPTPRDRATSEHLMRYRAGTTGLEAIGVRTDSAHWHCTCGAWRYNAYPMPRRVAGNNLVEAKRAWAEHAAEADTPHRETL